MKIDSSSASALYAKNASSPKDLEREKFKEKVQSGEITAKTLTQAYLVEYSLKVKSYSSDSFETQSAGFDPKKLKEILKEIDFESIGYTGKSIVDMTPEEAKQLVSEDGFFGITQTSQRLADFVLNGSGDDLERLKAGREGILQGFNEAETIWGGKLPDISYETLKIALQKIDEKITAMGGTLLDTNA